MPAACLWDPVLSCYCDRDLRSPRRPGYVAPSRALGPALCGPLSLSVVVPKAWDTYCPQSTAEKTERVQARCMCPSQVPRCPLPLPGQWANAWLSQAQTWVLVPWEALLSPFPSWGFSFLIMEVGRGPSHGDK